MENEATTDLVALSATAQLPLTQMATSVARLSVRKPCEPQQLLSVFARTVANPVTTAAAVQN